MITSGELKQLIDIGLRGVTSNPAIFEKAIAGSNDYDEDLKQLLKTGAPIVQIYETLAIKDISLAADQPRRL
jgi:transaldolase